MSLSRAKLTPEEEAFYRLLLVRATSETIGQPYISYALFELTPVSAPGLRTMGVDRFWRVYIDFEYMMEKGVKYASKVLNHEPWHLLRDHPKRFVDMGLMPDGTAHNPKAWNVAGDLTINGDIPDLVPDDGCFPGKGIFAKYKHNNTTELYYKQLMEDEDFKPKDECPECGKSPEKDKGDDKDKSDDKSDDKGDDAGDDSGDSEDGSADGDNGEEDGDGDGEGDSDSGDGSADGKGEGDSDSEGDGADGGAGNAHGKNGSGKPCSTCDGHGNQKGDGQGRGAGGGLPDPECGSGAGNKLKDYELGEGEAPSVDDERGEQIKQAVAEAVKDYARSNPGSLPGNIEVWADQTLKGPEPDWRTILRGQIKQAISYKKGQMDYNRTRRNRRQPNPKIITPALMAPRPRLAMAVDLSGSHVHKLGVVVDQAIAIVKSSGIRNRELMAFGVDVRATDPKFVADPRKVLEKMTGGGGTDMRVAFEVFAELDKRNKADISLLFTDLQTDWPSEPPHGKMKHIVCGIVDSRAGWEMEWVTRAEEAIGSWAKIVIIDVAEGDN